MKFNFFLVLFIFFIISKKCFGQNPRVKITQTVPRTLKDNIIVVERDTDLVMECYAENLYSHFNVRWQREYTDSADGINKTQAISQDMALDDNIHYGIESPSQYTWKLRVRGIQSTDTGTYVCFVQLTQTSRAEDQRKVFVIVKPFLEPQNVSPDTYANEGENINLICNATGIPKPIVIWSRLGGQLLSIGQEKYEGSILPIFNIQASERGTYICNAMNEYGQIFQHIEVNVYFKPIVKVGSRVVRQAVGYRVELQCFVQANPNPKIELSSWMKGSTSYTISSDKYQVNAIEGAFNQMVYELIIYDVQPEDYGEYVCRVSNDEINKEYKSASIRLEKTTIPQSSIKFGKVVRGNENPINSSTVLQETLLLILSFISVSFFII